MTQAVTILLVEDDPSMLDGMHDLLEMADIGYDITVLPASDGLTALRKMQEKTPDLIVSDVMMPNMGGYEFLDRVRDNPDWANIPFIFVTAKGEKEDKRKGKLSDADLYITKPFVINQLLELIQTQLNRVSKRQARTETLMESLKKNLLQILNHEFRTPLTYVTAYYEMLALSTTNYEDAGNYNEYLRGIQAGSIRLTKLVEDFITVMELRSGEMQAQFRREATAVSHLTTMLQDLVTAVANSAQAKNVQIHLDLPDTLPAVYGSETILRDVFERLLDNAIKFTAAYKKISDQEGLVTVCAEADDNEVRIHFIDQGMGLPAHIQTDIFDLFVQHNRELVEQQGAGVGLTIVQGALQLHEGRIEVKSEEGVGSTFTAVLPRYTKAATTPDEPSVPTKREKIPATILIVEDDEYLLSGLEDLLELYEGDYQIRTLTATNGEEGLEVLQKQLPDLIISDIMMPKMDGFEFLRRVRENPHWFHIPFMFLTAKGEKQDEFQGFRLGVDEYVTKPYNSDDMLRFVTKQLDRYFLARSKQAQNFDELKRSIINLITPGFRAPLDAVSTNSAQLSRSLEKAQTDEALKESLEGIYEGGILLTRLIEEVIALAELRTGETQAAFDLRAYPIKDLGLQLYQECQQLGYDLKSSGWTLRSSLNQSVPPVFGDTSILFNALERLIYVGTQHGQIVEPQQVVMSIDNSSNEVVIDVHLTAYFEPDLFARLQTALLSERELPEQPEFGPSLLTCKGYIQLHNGRIEVSNGRHEGIHFHVYLPIYTGEPDTETGA